MPPLQGVRVIDLTRVLAGPFCTMMLGDMGADVLKIEDPEHGDEVRGWAPFIDGWSSYFLGVNRSKRSVILDLKEPEGADALRHLVRTADVLIENFRPGSLAALGFGYPEMAELNPRLIYCSISGYGQHSPGSQRPGYDVVIQGEAGVMDVTGFPDGEPTRTGIAITDYLAGLYASQGILLAMVERQRSGKGQHVDIALFDSMLSVMHLPVGILLATGKGPGRFGNEHPSIAPYETFAARDGSMIVAVGNPRLWTRFCAALERPDLCKDERFKSNTERVRHRKALRGIIEPIFREETVAALTARFEAHQVPCGPVRSIEKALADPQVHARHMFDEYPHPTLGSIKALGNPVKLSRTPAEIRLAPPQHGEHTDELLTELRR